MTMSDDLVPLVMLPRFTTYAGRASPSQYFATIGMDLTEYDQAVINMWRGNVVGSITPGFAVWFEESTDQDNWTVCTGAPGGAAGCDPGQNTEQQYTLAIRKRWFRMRVQLGGADNVVTCWAVGYLHLRSPLRPATPASPKPPATFGGFFRK